MAYPKLLGLFTLAAFSYSLSSLDGCTGIKLTAQDGSFVHGRTLEFGIVVDSSIAVIPREFSFVGTTPNGPGLKYTAKYAAVGTIAFNNPAIMDGMNEKGLAVGAFYFPGFAGYATISSDNQTKALSAAEFSNWIVTQFATVDEVKEGLKNVVIAPTVLEGWGAVAPPLHYIVYDKAGKCLVIEPIDGKFTLYDNPQGVITNSPTFDWHLTNLRNYINLSPINVPPRIISGITFASFGQGSGLVGLPGDFTPPSRFVRAAIFAATAEKSKTVSEAVFQLFHLLNQFDIPVGVAREVVAGVTYSDYTQITCVRDPQSLIYYFKTYENQTVRQVNLNSFDLSAKEIKTFNTSQGKELVEEISSKLQPMVFKK